MKIPGIFKLIKNSPGGNARAGELSTAHGTVQTPVFCPVASQGTVKTLTPDEIRGIGFEMLLANTYHLYLRPGIEVVENLGGLHNFMSWDKSILTDSGGYQVFSLSRLRKVTDEGVVFRSHIDGSEHLITPESAIRYQEALGGDIAMVLDECPAPDESDAKVKEATERTHRWAERCLETHSKSDQSLFAIVQGGMSLELRQQSAEYLASLDFPGYAIGGLSIGESKQVTLEMLDRTVPYLPEDKPRYLMGVGSPEDIVEGVHRGIDIFDSALPTRVARNGALYTRQGRLNIGNAKFSKVEQPLDPECDCYPCRTFSTACLHHLFNARELLAYRLATIHNLTFMKRLLKDIRQAILEDRFESFRTDFLAGYKPTNEQVRLAQKQKWLKRRA